MNQHRWTYTSIVVLTSVLAPIANVYAQVLSPAVGAADSYQQSSLPIITPLIVTEIETDLAVPTVRTIELPKKPSQPATIQPTSQTGTPIASLNQPSAATQVKKTQFQLPQQLSAPKLAARTSTFINQALQHKNSVRREGAPVFVLDNPSAPFVAKSGAIETPLPSELSATNTRPEVVTVKAVSSPLIVNHNRELAFSTKKTAPTIKITNTATIQAEIARLPQAAPSISQTDDIPENLGFIAGTPTFVFENERPQQIIATAIAQVGNTIVAPEPSIAIPVQSPKQSTLPTQLPLPAEFDPNPAQQPTGDIQPPQPKIVAIQTGQASWYGREGGPKTANGENYNPDGLTAAHRTLPFGTKVRVISLKTGKSVTVRINDRGPFHSRRILDVSAGAAAAIGIKNDGIGNVRMEILGNDG